MVPTTSVTFELFRVEQKQKDDWDETKTKVVLPDTVRTFTCVRARVWVWVWVRVRVRVRVRVCACAFACCYLLLIYTIRTRTLGGNVD